MFYIVVYTNPETDRMFSAKGTTLESAIYNLVKVSGVNTGADFYMDYLEVYRGESINITREITFTEV